MRCNHLNPNAGNEVTSVTCIYATNHVLRTLFFYNHRSRCSLTDALQRSAVQIHRFDHRRLHATDGLQRARVQDLNMGAELAFHHSSVNAMTTSNKSATFAFPWPTFDRNSTTLARRRYAARQPPRRRLWRDDVYPDAGDESQPITRANAMSHSYSGLAL